MTITAPETLAGLNAQSSGEEAKLVFEDTEASFGPPDGLGVCAMSAPALMCEAWTSGYVQQTGREEGLLHVTYLCGYGEDELRVDTWFQEGTPLRAELSQDGRMAVQIDLSGFILQKAEDVHAQKSTGGDLAGATGT